ncbi:cellulose synthase/poly-beta-1,6-N-acetylglucosamine synthase-like glycosyltransferase [Bacillus ectoiniformans]|uniref:DUF3267 domain-containing protein n=1 Tax=Bacillus ectoiniformans TaxID=1494429 RepID=UPI00195D2E37|nr:DUF3267 domain-containing protein [Bacillus ectoiniformans]MBM7647614.1 cellulose synthase/poly-beta-1,6-N-acetylglucosamine synthase-like glycosyltransferase [Bacillus ectoiniformans]
MKCWRSFDFEKRYGFNKIIIFSLLIAMMTFSFTFALMQSVYSEALYAQHFSWFLIGMILIYPLHKFLHTLPILKYIPKMSCKYQMKYFCLPVISINIKDPLPKKRFMISLVFPFVVLTPLLFMGASLNPHYLHYFLMLTAYHTGICAIDFLYLKALTASPKYAVIEENDEGYEILVPQ